MKVAVIGWGALIWDHRRLEKGESWELGGPALPLGWGTGPRPSLDLDPEKGREIATHYVVTSCKRLEEAMERFCFRDDTELTSLGYIHGTKQSEQLEDPVYAELRDRLLAWGEEHGVDAVLWRWANQPAVTFH